MKIQFAWHVHHDRLIEPLTGSIEERIAYIKEHKPKHERDIRIRLLKPVIDPLPTIFVEAWKAYVEARKAYDETWKAYDEARKAYDETWKAYDEAEKAYDEAEKAYDETWKAYVEARKAYDEAGTVYEKARRAFEEAWEAFEKARRASEKSIIELHLNECPNCPWDGNTIFPAL